MAANGQVPWQAVQVGVGVIVLAVIFVGGVAIATDRWWLLIMAAVAVLILAGVQVALLRRRRTRVDRRAE